MHYAVNNVDLGMHRIDVFIDRFVSDDVGWIEGREVEVTAESISGLRSVVVLKPAR